MPAFPTLDLDGKLGKMDRVVLGWTAVFWLTAMVEGLQVTVPDKKKVAMLFQPTVLRCHFSTSSHQPAVVQWKFKSYCQDRMGESLGMSSPRAQALSKRNLEWDPYLDCLDSRRTVRVVASKQGSTVTLGDFYRGREITIVHDADLQIGKLMWGDSGLYYCIITTPDDLEGKNEDSVELLVLGRTGLLADLLPSFAVEIMPVRKGYRIQADKERDSMKVLYYVEKELAQFDPARRMRGRYNNTISELSSLHDDDSNFRQSYHQMRNKQFPMSGDLESNPDYWSGVMGGNSGTNRGPALEYNKEDRESFRHSQQRSKSEMLSRKNFATGVPAVSMDELAAFADSYGQRSRRANGNSHEARAGSRFERSESRAHGAFYQDGSLDEYYGRGRSREPPGDGERGWTYSPAPARRRPPEDAPLPRLVSRTPGTAPKYDHSYLSSVLERQARPESSSRGGSLETPSKLGAQLGPRSASYYAWSPPTTYKAGASEGEDEDDAADEDALPPYSELELSRGELSRGPSYRGRDLSFHSNSEKRRKKEPAKKPGDFPTRMSLVV
ncbi:immunoglobulin-like domain-containing receptor 2 isoform 5 precursor [Mus musculus]|uniref:Immunoglobulin-like domain-containing receptor 2 n=2 Tax=Mus musculus TaxID=10090 RepID=A0A0A6YVY9_MOUSE|nr:immunoglobulin-like domain-containing receptor 2 isoform 5 precursor [Mus musculus]